MHVRSSLIALTIATGVATPAHADKPTRASYYIPKEQRAEAAAGLISNKLFINRCKTGCTFTQSSGGTSNSRLNQTQLGGDGDPGFPGSGTPGTVYMIPACGTAGRPNTEPSCQDAVFADVMACITEVYAPYDVIVTETDPGASVAHHEAVFAGVASDMGLNPGVGGVGPINCALHEDTVSFSFDVWGTVISEICSTIAQESGHGFNIEHSFNCLDAMGSGYVAPCGPQFYFRNGNKACADESMAPVGGPRDCICQGGQQNVHQKMLEAFGPNPTPLPSPDVTLNVPADGATFPAGGAFTVSGVGTDPRGIGRAEVWFNGYKWDSQTPGVPGQDTYMFNTPGNLPDGVIDVELRLYNDLETVYGSQSITVTKGAPCADETSCLAGQHCDAGKCAWDAPTGEFGADCDYDQFCLSELCVANQCSSACQVGVSGFCPEGSICESDGGGIDGFCIADDGGGGGGGCCSTSDGTSTGALLAQLGLAGLVLGGTLRRRRKK